MTDVAAAAGLIEHPFEPCPTSPEILCVWCGTAEAAHPVEPAPNAIIQSLLHERL